MKTIILLILLLISSLSKAQDSLYFEDSKVVALDSIDYCNTHYLISFIAVTDTFKTIIRKESIDKSVELVGHLFDIELIVLDSLIIGTNYGVFKYNNNVHVMDSHHSNDTYGEFMIKWKIGGAVWWKKHLELRMSIYYFGPENIGYPFLVKKIIRKKANQKG